ncbi:hypothetical protein PsorP6_010083 [Peronosclerospora sorghi]|uniref:Uncharacterized protein n=1 Tax=Peronosclerospora sorghi TaxID=230839 RepID=A0ACC0VX36_9STRA|nr:hypothetical protein PsorP6_010083 [Peronosclerospora sorghi]
MQAYLVSRVIFTYYPQLPVNTSRDTNSEEKSTTLWVCSDDGRLTEDTASIGSELDDHKRLKPKHEELVAMDLHSGMNELVFVLHSQDPVEEVARVTATLYVCPVHSKVVIAHMDGAIISCVTTGRMFKRRVQGAMHSGAVDSYAKLSQNGYHVVYVTFHGLAQANVLRTRFRSNVRDKGEASLPMGPVLHSPERLLSTASFDDTQDVNMATLDAFRLLFSRCMNPFYASFSTTQAAGLVFTKMGVFSGKVFMVDPNDVSLRHQSIGGFRESYTSLLDRMDRISPLFALQRVQSMKLYVAPVAQRRELCWRINISCPIQLGIGLFPLQSACKPKASYSQNRSTRCSAVTALASPISDTYFIYTLRASSNSNFRMKQITLLASSSLPG